MENLNIDVILFAGGVATAVAAGALCSVGWIVWLAGYSDRIKPD
jgi:hypothetical protein